MDINKSYALEKDEIRFLVGSFIGALVSVGLLASDPWITSKSDILMASAAGHNDWHIRSTADNKEK
jgi:hypothetical protein